MAPRAERVAVTGVGLVSALGGNARETFRRLCAGESGIGPVTSFDVAGYRCSLAAEVKGLEQSFVPPPERDLWSRSDVMAVAAAREALASGGLADASAELSLAVGGTTGGMREAERVLATASESLPEQAARRLLSYPLSTSLERLVGFFGATGHLASLCSACSSGANALALGASWIERGRARRVLAGGTDALCRLTFAGFNALGVMAAEPCRPFDAARNGLTLGEGAAFLLLESESGARERGADILAWLEGWSVGAEAHHITHPEPSGATATRLLLRALERAGVGPDEVDYVNAHGTATLQNDAAEARALGAAFGRDVERVLVSSSKGQVGHTLGAAGALEAAFTVLAIRERMAPPTGGLVTPDPELRLRHVLGRAEPMPIRAALSSSFGFGGAGTVLVLTEPERVRERSRSAPSTLRVSSVVTLSARGIVQDAEIARAPAEPPEAARAREPWLERLDAARSRRFDRASALVTLGAAAVSSRLRGERQRVGLVAGSAYGNVERSVEFLRRVFERGPRFASPADFPHLLPSAPVGNASIYLGLEGPVLSLADLATSAESALCAALALLEDGQADEMIAGSAEPYDAVVERLLSPLHGEPADDGAERGEGASFALLSRDGAASDPWVAFWSDAARPELVPSPRSPRALAWCLPGAEGFVRASAWRDVRLRLASARGVPAEARGGFGVARAVASLLADETDEALWVSVGRAHAYAFLFRRGAGEP